jgi:hypothetical protein
MTEGGEMGRPDLPPTRRGYSPHEVVSALQKAIRRSQVRQAVYWGMELYISGYAAWMWARLQEISSEDIGPADRYLPATLAALRESSDLKRKKKNSGGMEAVHALILLATAPKSGIACWMVMVATGDHHERYEIPDEARDQHTRAGRQMGRGVDHFVEEGAKKIQPRDYQEDPGNFLAQIENEYLDQWHRACNGDRDLPDNPKGDRQAAPEDSWLPGTSKKDEEARVASLFDGVSGPDVDAATGGKE